MTKLWYWFRQHTFQAHLAVFFLLVLPPIPLYFAAESNASGWIWALVGLIVAGNLLAVLIR